MRFFLSGLLLFLISVDIHSQKYFRVNNTGYNNYELSLIENTLHGVDANFHTNVKPFLNTTIVSTAKDSSLQKIYTGNSFDSYNDSAKADFGVELIFNSQPSYQLNPDKFFYENYIGTKLNFLYKNKLAITAGGVWNNSSYASYVDSFIQSSQMSPGFGTAYPGKWNFASRNYFGYVSYSPNKIFNLQAGNDKHFWGDGYRSLFLSDFAPAFPYFKTTATVWKLKYVCMYAMYKDAVGAKGIEKDYKNKYSTLHFLSWNITKRINVGFFESIIWQGTDKNRSRGYDLNYLNPVIFFRPVEYSLGSSDNAFLGFSFKVKVFKKQHVYGQLLLDEFLLKEVRARNGWWANKQAFQLGFRSFDSFKINNLNVRLEGNYVRPYTYSHGSVQQSYGHMNHPLAHPLGANFIEGVGIVNYRYKKIGAELKITHAVYGSDSSGYNMGKNIFASYTTRPRDYNNYMTQGVETNLTTVSASVNYLVYISRPLYLEAGLIYRNQQSYVEKINSPYFYFSIKSPLWNEYRDF